MDDAAAEDNVVTIRVFVRFANGLEFVMVRPQMLWQSQPKPMLPTLFQQACVDIYDLDNHAWLKNRSDNLNIPPVTELSVLTFEDLERAGYVSKIGMSVYPNVGAMRDKTKLQETSNG